MARDRDRQEADAEQQKDRGPRAGERLSEARRSKQLSVVEIAKELHLDEPKVRALERNDFESLGAPVFAKGHLRKYAQLVGIDPDDVLTEYYEMNRGGPAPLVVSKTAKPRTELTPGPWIGVIVVFILVAAAYWWFAVRAPVSPTTPDPEPAVAEPDTAAASEPEPDEAPVPEGSAVEQQQLDASAPAVEEPEAEPEPAVEPDDGLVRMTIAFSGDCWTEISDAGGSRLFFGLGRRGRTVEVSGEPPLNVLFGDASNVDIAVNGVARPIAAAERRGKTARFSVTEP